MGHLVNTKHLNLSSSSMDFQNFQSCLPAQFFGNHSKPHYIIILTVNLIPKNEMGSKSSTLM